jgi:hypothetical protein
MLLTIHGQFPYNLYMKWEQYCTHPNGDIQMKYEDLHSNTKKIEDLLMDMVLEHRYRTEDYYDSKANLRHLYDVITEQYKNALFADAIQ